MVERVTRSYKLRPETAAAIDRMAAESDTYKSKIVENAVSEYADQDRQARIEAKLDALVDLVDGEGGSQLSEIEGKIKESDDGDRGHSPAILEEDRSETGVDLSEKCPANGNGLNKSERAVVFFELATREGDRVTVGDIDDAIEEGWGDASDHMVNNYRPRVQKLLDDRWISVVGTAGAQVWARDYDVLPEVVSETASDLQDELNQGGHNPEKLESLRKQFASLHGTSVDNDVSTVNSDSIMDLITRLAREGK